MEDQKNSTSGTAFTFGLYLGIISIVYSLLLYFLGMFGNKAMGYLSYIISIAVIAWAMLNFRDKVNGGYMRYGQGVGLGTLTAVVGGVISSVFAFVLFKYIDPSLIDQLMSQAMEEAMSKGDVSDEQLEMVEKMTGMFINPTAMFFMGLIGSAIGGVIISLILAAIFKKEKPLFEAQAEE